MILLLYFVRNAAVTRGNHTTIYPERVTCREWFANTAEVIDFVKKVSPNGNPLVNPEKKDKTKIEDYSRGL